MTAPPRYDGCADWYDAKIGVFADAFGDGIRRRAGARHVPLAEFLNA